MKRTATSRLVMKYRLGSGGSRCPICNKLLGDYGFDLHEALFTRGDLSGVEWQDEIFHQYNCVGVCTKGCHLEATSDKGQVDCAKSLIKMHGYKPILEWIDTLPFKSSTTKTVAQSVLLEAQNG